jgi:Protein of unknown function (DUF3224)
VNDSSIGANMNKNSGMRFFLIGVLCFSFECGGLVLAQSQTAVVREAAVTRHAKGTFEAALSPQTGKQKGSEAIGTMSIDKKFHGDLQATSKGDMLTFSAGVSGSAGYVAMEQVSGALDGRKGTFVLQHSGTMTRGTPELSVRVVPDSGTDGLEGLAGSMKIEIINGKHLYDFEYTLGQK